MFVAACGAIVILARCGSPGGRPAPTVAVVSTVPAGATVITEVTTDNKFSQGSLATNAGQLYALTVKNEGQAIHNWHITDAKSAGGQEIMGPLTDPGKSSTIAFTINQPGTYHFVCDVHPNDMKGTITVR